MFWLSDVFTGTDTARNIRLYETRARAARARVLRRALGATGGAVLRISASVARRIASRLRTARRRRALARAMNRTDEHILKDIGLTREDVAMLNRGEWPVRHADHDGLETPKRGVEAAEVHAGTYEDARGRRGWRRAA